MKKGYPNHPYRVTTNLKQLVKTAASTFGDKVYFRSKGNIPEDFVEVTFSEFDEMVDSIGTAFYAMGLGKKNIAVIRMSTYN